MNKSYLYSRGNADSIEKAGRYIVTITLKGNYSGTVKKIFNIECERFLRRNFEIV